MAAVLALLRRTLTPAAVVAAQFDVQLASTWRPFGALKAPSWPKRRPRGPSEAQEAPRRGQDEAQRCRGGPKLSPRGVQENPSSVQKASKKAPRAAKEPSKSTWTAPKAMFEKVQKVPYCRAELEVWGALGRHLGAKLEPKMASKCALAAQHGVQVRFVSPTWQF